MTISLVKCSVDKVFLDTQRTCKLFIVSECGLNIGHYSKVHYQNSLFILSININFDLLLNVLYYMGFWHIYLNCIYLFDMVVFSCNPALKNPEIVAQRGGLSTILKNVIDCQLSRINEALITTILHLLNHPHTRQYMRADVELEVCVHAAKQWVVHMFIVVQV
uniref:Rapamycin-insensitive companion of mTOR N-terminal domain-containing protein n=1 Tax=Sinocyclocheilus rhinocerous TaxID=307959 RepID=A0A673FPR2_9TELE